MILALKDGMIIHLHYLLSAMLDTAISGKSPRDIYAQQNKPSKTFYFSLQFWPQIPKQSTSQLNLSPWENEGILLLRKNVLKKRQKPTFDSFPWGPHFFFYKAMISKESKPREQKTMFSKGLEHGSVYYGLLAKPRLLPGFV